MASWAKTQLARIHQLMLMIAILIVGIWAMDHLTTAGSDAPDAPPPHRTDGGGRTFVFLIDSLRFQTATDPEAMPYLASMRARGVHARVTSSRDAVTVSAIREMFTGRERFLAFGFFRDFVTGRESVESLFTQTRALGIATSVYPPYAFVQFADDLPTEPVDASVTDRDEAQQNRWVRQALARFSSHEKRFAVSHIVYSDRVAHDHGIHGKSYRDTFASIDSLIAELDAAIDPDDTLVVAGDHGHTDNGRHSLGLDVPTFALYRGARFEAGVDLGDIPITAHRYLMSWSLGLPLEGYASSRHPDALRGELSPAYARAISAEEAKRAASGPRIGGWAYWLLALDLGAMLGIWLAVIWGHVDRRRGLSAMWLGLLAVACVVVATWLLALPIAIAALVAAYGAVRERAHRAFITIAGASAAGGAVHAWGRVLAANRDWVHEPNWAEMEQLALIVIAVTALAAWKIGAAKATWVMLAIVGALGYPTVYRYGAMPALVTMWLAWLAALVVEGRKTARHRYDALMLASLAAGAFLLLQPFAFADAGNFEMSAWRPWVHALMPHGHEAWVEATLIVKLIIFARHRVPHRVKALGVFAAWQVWRVQWGFDQPGDLGYVVTIAILVALGALIGRLLGGAEHGAGARESVEQRAAREVRRVCWLWALFLAYYYTIRIPHDHYMWADFMLAALVISARLSTLAAPADGAHHEAIGSMLALVFAGWVTVAWTLHLYEWKVLYSWFPAAFLEEQALLFIPFINGRYILPVLMARMLLREGFVRVGDYPRDTVWTALGVKVVSLTCIVTGIGFVMADSEVYLEALGEGAALMVYAVGLL